MEIMDIKIINHLEIMNHACVLTYGVQFPFVVCSRGVASSSGHVGEPVPLKLLNFRRCTLSSGHVVARELRLLRSLVPRRSCPPGERTSGVLNELSCHKPHEC